MKSFCSKALVIAPVLLSFALPSYSVSEITPVIDVSRAEISSPNNDMSPYGSTMSLTSHPIVATARHENLSNGQSDYTGTGELYEWLLYPEDPNLILLGGKESNFGDINTATSNWTIPTPVDFQIDGTNVDELVVYNHGLVEVVSSSDGVLAWASVAPDFIDYRENAQQYNLISVRTRESIILVTYELKNHSDAASSWTVKGQVRINTELPSIGHKLDKSSFSDALFNLTSGELSCEIRHQGLFYNSKGTPAEFKTRASEADAAFQNNTSNVCEITEDGEILLGFYNDPSFEDPELPEFEHYSSAESTFFGIELSEQETYTTMLRHTATGVWGTGKSDWSIPVTFITAGNAEFHISFNELSGENVLLEVPETGAHMINMTITNTGESQGRPVVTMYISQDDLNSVAERVSLVHGFDGECAVTDSDQIECISAETVQPGDSISFDITTMISEEGQSQYFSMSACSENALGCDYTNLEVRVATNSSTESDSGSSGGGAMFFLTLLALPLLRRRQLA